MKTGVITTSVLAVGLLFGGGSAARAFDLNCNTFKQTLGDAGRNPPISARVLVSSAGWTVRYILANGDIVDRSKQYAMNDESDATKTEWHG
jgi:hypothetical protein